MAAAASAVKANFHNKAPIELAGEFISAVMRQDFHDALVLCQALLLLEPNNKTYIEFEKVLREAKERKIKIDEESSESDHTTEDEDDKNNNMAIGSDNDTSSLSTSDDEADSGNNESSDESDLTDSDSSSDGDIDLEGDLDSSDSEDEDVSPDDLKGLNLLVGGLSVSRSG